MIIVTLSNKRVRTMKSWPILAVLAALPAFGALDPSHDVLIYWPGADSRVVPALREIGVRAVITPPADDDAGFLHACREAGIVAFAEIEDGGIEERAAQARLAGFGGIAYPGFGDEKTVAAFAARHSNMEQFVFLSGERIAWRVAPARAVLREGAWPGFRPRDIQVASATAAPWVDANSYLIAYLRGLFPDRPALLGYRADAAAGVSTTRALRFESLEIALAEAAAAGGNVILAPPENYRAALVAGEAAARRAWQSLGRTARFLSAGTARLSGPVSSRIAVAASSLERHGEILNMLFRRNAPAPVLREDSLPAFQATRREVLVVPDPSGSAASRKAALAFAFAGGRLLVAPGSRAWTAGARKIRGSDECGCDIYALGKGEVHAYREQVLDPAEFALDAIEAEGWSTRDVRIFANETVLALPHRLDDGKLDVALVNYSWRAGSDFTLRVEGAFQRATFYSPETPSGTALKVARFGSGTEIEARGFECFAEIIME
jgi:hypothetical protein